MNIRKDINEFLEEVYHLDALKVRFKEFINTNATKLQHTRIVCKEEQFVTGGQALPLLHELGWQFLTSLLTMLFYQNIYYLSGKVMRQPAL